MNWLSHGATHVHHVATLKLVHRVTHVDSVCRGRHHVLLKAIRLRRMLGNVRGLTRALNESGRYKYMEPESVIDYLVIGGGVIGLAISQRLCASFPSSSVCLLERNKHAGEEISSRNSEVIHSGIYYPPKSLKTSLCLRGRELMYERCRTHNIPYRQTGKLIVARKGQQPYLENLHRKSIELQASDAPQNRGHLFLTKLLSGQETRDLEPSLSTDIVASLWCPMTGIVDSHGFMQSLEKDIQDSDNGELVYGTKAVRIDRYQKSITADMDGWIVQTSSRSESYAVLAKTIINAAGLGSTLVTNSVLPREKRIPMYFAKGSYASYHGPGTSNISHLVYPCPETGPDVHSFESLGTHLTLDLQGKIRFGPDIEWIDPMETELKGDEDDFDFWTKRLVPVESKLPEMHKAITSYLPSIAFEGLWPDYCGIRPKLTPPSGRFQDFLFRMDYPSGDAERNRSHAMVSLLGIESPGLTSSLAIAERVVENIRLGY